MPHCFIVIRVSTADQARGYSLANQRHDLPALARKHNLKFTHDDIFDFGVASTSKKDDMSMWGEITQRIETGIYDSGFMIVREIDRSHRDFGFGLQLIAILYEHNINILTPQEKIESRNLGGILTTLVKYFSAEDEKRKRKREQRRAFQAARDNGMYIFAARTPPDGYIWDRNTKSLVPHPKRKAIICDLLSKTQYSDRELLAYARDKGYRGVAGGHYSLTSIRRIRKRPTYAGLMYNNQGQLIKARNIQPIIDEDLYYENQTQAQARNSNKTTKTGKYLLTGLLRCGYCDHAMIVETNRATKQNRRTTDWKGYACTGKTRNLICDESKRITMSFLDDIVKQSIEENFGDLKAAKHHIEALKVYYAADQVVIQALEDDLHDLMKKAKNIANSIAAGIELTTVTELARTVQNEIEKKRAQIQRMEDNCNNILPSIDEIVMLLKNFSLWSLQQQKAYLNSSHGIEVITYYNDHIDIKFKLSPEIVQYPVVRSAKYFSTKEKSALPPVSSPLLTDLMNGVL